MVPPKGADPKSTEGSEQEERPTSSNSPAWDPPALSSTKGVLGTLPLSRGIFQPPRPIKVSSLSTICSPTPLPIKPTTSSGCSSPLDAASAALSGLCLDHSPLSIALLMPQSTRAASTPPPPSPPPGTAVHTTTQKCPIPISISPCMGRALFLTTLLILTAVLWCG